MALVVMFLFSLLGLATATVGFLGFGFSISAAIATYVALAASGPVLLVLSQTQVQAPDRV
ncbi:hypothetical protein [Thalassovita sp.]|uniref:hypothetical protein n=1 Tax=Thalassovita sp. TaxID=1979401 RepID=UPI0029DE8BF8|nr:hypothetical protein [Thalassovita sp.]